MLLFHVDFDDFNMGFDFDMKFDLKFDLIFHYLKLILMIGYIE